MINLAFDLVTGLARLATTAVLKLGSDVPVRVVFSAAPGDATTLQLALGTDATPPAVLAFTEDFSSENETTWTALLDASDTRLATFMTGKRATNVNAELICVVDGARQVAPNLQVTVQPAIVTGPTSSQGGPDYYTEEEVDALLAAAIATESSARASVVQRQYLGAGQSLTIGDEECLIVAGSFRNDGTITFSGSGFIHFI